MKQVSEMPKTGQFVAVWQCHDGYIDSAVLMWDTTGALLVATIDGYYEEDIPRFYTYIKAVYFVTS
jgi:hypothetical protein